MNDERDATPVLTDHRAALLQRMRNSVEDEKRKAQMEADRASAFKAIRAQQEASGEIETAEPTVEEIQESENTNGFFKEAFLAVAGGAEDAVNGIAGLVQEVMMPNLEGNNSNFANGLRERRIAKGQDPERGADPYQLDLVPDNQTTGGQLARGITQFFVPYLGLGKVLSATTNIAKLGKIGQWTAEMGKGAAVDFSAFDPDDPHLADLIDEHWPDAKNPIIDYLKADPTDESGEKRLKAALEGAIIGTGATAVIGAVTGIRAVMKGSKKAAVPLSESGKAAAAADVTSEGDALADAGLEPVKFVRDVDADGKKLKTYSHTYEGAEVVVQQEGRNWVMRAKAPDDNSAVENLQGAVDHINKLKAAWLDNNQNQIDRLFAEAKNLPDEIKALVNKPMKSADDAIDLGDALFDRLEEATTAGAVKPPILAKATSKVELERKLTEDAMGKAKAAADEAQLKTDLEEGGRPTGVEGVATIRGARAFGNVEIIDPDTAALYKPGVSIHPEMADEAVAAMKNGDVEGVARSLNFNFENIEASDDILELLNETEQAFDPVIQAAKRGAGDPNRLGVQTQEATEMIANIIGGDPRNINQTFNSTGNLASRVLAARHLVVTSTQHLYDLAKKVANGPDDPLAELAYEKHLTRHGAVIAQMKGIQTEIARALNQFKYMAKDGQIDPEAFEEAMKMVAGGRKSAKDRAKKMVDMLDENGEIDARQIARAAEKGKYARTRDAWLEMFINGLLSAPATQIVNMSSNAAVTGLMVTEKLVGAAIGAVRRNPERIRFQEVTEHVYGIGQGFVDAFRINGRVLLAAAKGAGKGRFKEAADLIREDAESFGSVYRVMATGEPVLDNLSKVETHSHQSISSEAFGIDKAKKLRAGLVNWVGTGIRLPGRGLLTADEFFKSINYRAKLRSEAYRDAVYTHKLTDRNQIKAHIEKVMNDPHKIQRSNAMASAREATFTTELGESGKAFQKIIAENPLARIIVPFVRTPINIVKYTGDRMGMSSRFFEDMKAGGAAADQAMGRLSTGISLVTTGMFLHQQGNIVGNPPSDKEGREAFFAAGKLPNSVKIGDKWVQFSRFDPIGMYLGITADVSTAMQNYDGSQEHDDVVTEMMVGFVDIARDNLLSKTYLQGVTDIVNVMSDFERYGAYYVPNLAANLLMPYSSYMSSQRREEDPIMRDTRGETMAESVVNAWSNKMQTFSERMPPKRDFWGRIRYYPETAGAMFLGEHSPIAVWQEDDDPVLAELINQRVSLRGADKRVDGMKITAEEQSRLGELFGQVQLDGQDVHTRLSDMIQSYEYSQATDSTDEVKAVKYGILSNIIKYYRDAALRAFREENPEFDMRLAQHAAKKMSIKAGEEVSADEFSFNR